VQSVEQTSALRDEAWKTLLDKLHSHPESPEAQSMLALCSPNWALQHRQLLFNFLAKRSEWWLQRSQAEPLALALDSLRAELGVDMAFDPVATGHVRQQRGELLCVRAPAGG